MGWLFGQLWFLMLIAFLVGSLIAWLIVRVALPHADELEEETGLKSKGFLG